jgi:ribose transport system ATP-binding protein
MNDIPAIYANAIRKEYGPTVALDDATVKVAAGTVHALLGENGAGKSTLVKILSGLVRPDAGELLIHGKAVRFTSPSDAHKCGIQTAFQEMTQIPDLTVVENLLLLNEPTGLMGRIRRRAGEEMIAEHLADYGLGAIPLRAEMRTLDLAQRQKLEIARALFRKPQILLLDEPTSTLSGPDIPWLGDIVERCKSDGITTIFISHHLTEVRELCEFMTVLRNGRNVGSARVEELSDDGVVQMIIGRSLEATYPIRVPYAVPEAPIALAARNLTVGSRVKDVSFSLAAGEVLGVAGLQGMGQNELFLSCFGALAITSGSLLVSGQKVSFAGPADAIASGIGLVPEDRKTEGLFLDIDGTQNASLPSLKAVSRWGLIHQDKERARVTDAFRSVQLDTRAVHDKASSFSGGNQQKMVLAKWLLTNASVLLLMDPTRGVDVGTRYEFYVMIREFAKRGGSVLMISSEIPELVNVCDRVLVMYAHKVVGEIATDDLSEEAVMHLALGGQPGQKEQVA